MSRENMKAAERYCPTPDNIGKLMRVIPPDLIETFVAFIATVGDDTDFELVVIHDGQARDATHPGCGVWHRREGDIPCFAAACDELGNWSVMTTSGQIRQFMKDEVA